MLRICVLLVLFSIVTTIQGCNARKTTDKNNVRRGYNNGESSESDSEFKFKGSTTPKPRKIIPPTPNDCLVELQYDLPKNQPLIIRPGSKKDINGFYMPDKTGIIRFKKGDNILLSCTGKNNKLEEFNVAETLVNCDGYNKFLRSGKKYEMKNFNCTFLVQHTARKNTAESCDIPKKTNSFIIDIGFELPDGSFYTLMKSCFDPTNIDSLYTKFIQTPAIAGAQHGEQRPIFIEGSFYPSLQINSKYVRDGQLDAFARILGSKELATKYINDKGNYYLARGHLAARADFVFSSHQRATFYYVNVAPQWQTLNAGNWNTLEGNVRSFTASYGKDLIIYTGVYGVSTLPDVNNNQKPLYLHIENNQGKVKVPEIFWKVIHDPASNKAVAFVAINNPYESDFTPLCNDVCDRIRWLKWKSNNQKLGYGYCCNVEELRKTIDTIPKINVNGGLLI